MPHIIQRIVNIGQYWRWVVVLAMIAAAIFILLTPPKQQIKLADNIVRIQYWEKWTGEEGRQMKIIVDDFNNSVGKEKGIFVEYISMSSIDQKTLVATAAGVPPDIAGIWDGQVIQFAAMDALEPLDDLAREFGITPEHYKPVFWNACTYNGKLWALVSTPASIVLHYDKAAFADGASSLRQAGLDPDGLPKTIDELDRYAEALTTYENGNRSKIVRSGHLPLEPGWYVPLFPYWFGGDVFDESTQTLTVDTPANVRAFDWIASYSRKYGTEAFDQFRQGLGNFASAQNAFLAGRVAMEQQGPWMSNYIETYAPQMNRWNPTTDPAEKKAWTDQLAREQNFNRLRVGMSRAEIQEILGVPPQSSSANLDTWSAGIHVIHCTFDAQNKLQTMEMPLLPALERRKYTQWGAAPFPNAVSADKVIAFCPFDAFVIPRGSKHKREAFEFIAYVNRQEVMEKLCAMHCKNSPLAKVSKNFTDNHPNPYIQVFEDAANAPGAFALPQLPIWPEVADLLNSDVSQSCYLLAETADVALKRAEKRLEGRWDYYRSVQEDRARESN